MASIVPLGLDFIANTTTQSTQTTPVIAALANGGFAAIWISQDGSSDIRGRVFNADGTPVAGSAADFLISSTNTGAQIMPRLSALAGGGFIATWVSFDNGDARMRARVFNADGSAAAASPVDFLISSSALGTPGPPRFVFDPQVSALSNGGFAIAWSNISQDADRDVRARVFNANGSPAANNATDFIISVSGVHPQRSVQIAPLTNGDFVAA